MHARYDGLANLVTGLGDNELDTRQHTRRTPAQFRSVTAYNDEWRQSWMANREISQPARDMFREGFTLINVEPSDLDIGQLRSYIQGDLAVQPDGQLDRQKGLLWYARRWYEIGNKVGGSAIMPLLDDGLDPVHPLDVRRIQRIVGWEIFDRQELMPYWDRQTFNSVPRYYVLADVASGVQDGTLGELRPGDVIHRSRLFINPGRELSPRETRLRNGWGDSMLELLWRERRAAEEGAEYARTYMDRVSWLHYQMANLDELLRETDDDGNEIGPDLVRERMRSFRKMTRTMGVGVTDGGAQQVTTPGGQTVPARSPDQLSSLGESSGDLDKLVQMNLDHWQYGWQAPKSIAFGESPSGLRGGDNAGDWQSWGGWISGEQDEKGTPLVSWMLMITFASREGPTGGMIPTSFEIDWNSLSIPSKEEEHAISKAEAEIDGIRLGQKVVTVDEIRDQRIVSGDHGPLRPGGPDLVNSRQSIDVALATAVFTAASSVATGAVSVPFFAHWLSVVDPDAFPPKIAATLAAMAGPAPTPASPGSEAPGAADPAAQVVEAQDEVDDEFDPVEFAFSQDPIPSDLMPARDIAKRLTAEYSIQISTRLVNNYARKGDVRSWSILGKPGMSFAEVRRLIAGDNGFMEASERAAVGAASAAVPPATAPATAPETIT